MAILHEMGTYFEEHMIKGSILYLELQLENDELEIIGRIDCPELDCHPQCEHKKPLTVGRFFDLEKHIAKSIYESLKDALHFAKRLR